MNMLTMKNILHNKKWNAGTVKFHVYLYPVPQIKGKNNDKLDKYFVKTKLRRYPTSNILDRYKFKMALFDNGNIEELSLFIRDFNITL